MLPIPWWKQSSVVSLPPSRWLSTSENGSISRAQYSLCFRQTGQLLAIARSRSVNGSPCFQACAQASVPTTLLTSLLSDDESIRVKRLTGVHRKGQPIHLIIKIPLGWVHSLVRIHVRHKYFHTFRPFREAYLYTSFPKFLCPQLSNHVPSRSLTIQPNHWLQSMNWYRIAIWPFVLPGWMYSQVHCRKFWPLGGLAFTIIFQGCPREGLQCCDCPLAGGGHICRAICKPGLSLCFFCQLVTGDSPWNDEAQAGRDEPA